MTAASIFTPVPLRYLPQSEKVCTKSIVWKVLLDYMCFAAHAVLGRVCASTRLLSTSLAACIVKKQVRASQRGARVHLHQKKGMN